MDKFIASRYPPRGERQVKQPESMTTAATYQLPEDAVIKLEEAGDGSPRLTLSAPHGVIVIYFDDIKQLEVLGDKVDGYVALEHLAANTVLRESSSE